MNVCRGGRDNLIHIVTSFDFELLRNRGLVSAEEITLNPPPPPPAGLILGPIQYHVQHKTEHLPPSNATV
jgi:hypothetical protein